MRFQLPSPQTIRSFIPSAALMTLSPEPPVILSLPRLPPTSSSCLPPFTQSSPQPPRSSSSPSPPLRVSALPLPLTKSPPSLANMVSCLSVPKIESGLSVPEQWPPSHRIVAASATPLPTTIATATVVSKITARLTLGPPLSGQEGHLLPIHL